jgi:hypothetical protein
MSASAKDVSTFSSISGSADCRSSSSGVWDDKITIPKLLGLLTGFAGVVILMSKDFNASTSSILGQNPNRWSFIFHFTSFPEKILWRKRFNSNILKEWLFANALAL